MDAAESGLPLARVPRISTGTGYTQLRGVLVLDLTTSVAGPDATMLLADFGAEVIKIERPQGDDARHWGPQFLNGEGLWFLSVGRHKKSVVRDLTTEDGQAHLFALAATADVVVSNQPISGQRKLRLTIEDFRAVRPDIFMTTITGFGLAGVGTEPAIYDLIAEGYSGIMDVTGAADSDPQKVSASAADVLAGQDAAMVTLATLLDRQRTGQGHEIDIALAESMTRFLTCRISSYIGTGKIPKRLGGTEHVIAIYQAFETADCPIMLGLGSDAIWRRFWTAVGQPGYAENPDSSSIAKRHALRAKIVGDIQKIPTSRSRAEWLEVFVEARVPAGPINSVDQVAAEVGFHARGMIGALDDAGRLTPHIALAFTLTVMRRLRALLRRCLAPIPTPCWQA